MKGYTCPNCGGKGKIRFKYPNANITYANLETDYKVCLVCGGLGVVFSRYKGTANCPDSGMVKLKGV